MLGDVKANSPSDNVLDVIVCVQCVAFTLCENVFDALFMLSNL